MTLLENAANFANDGAILGPITAAITRAAVSILNEDPTTAHHTERANLAAAVMGEPSGYAYRFAWAVSTNDVVANNHAAGNMEAVFGDIQFVVSTIWDSVAGVVTTPA